MNILTIKNPFAAVESQANKTALCQECQRFYNPDTGKILKTNAPKADFSGVGTCPECFSGRYTPRPFLPRLSPAHMVLIAAAFSVGILAVVLLLVAIN